MLKITVTIEGVDFQSGVKAAILETLDSLGDVMSKEAIDHLRALVARETDLVKSVKTLIRGLRDQLIAAGTDEAALADLAHQMDSNLNELSADVITGTTPQPPAQRTDDEAEPANDGSTGPGTGGDVG